MEFSTTCMRCDFLDIVELLLCSSFSFLNKHLMMSLLRYLQPASNKRHGPKWACLTYCVHAESIYLTAKFASRDLPFFEQSAVRRAISLSREFSLTFVNFAMFKFSGVLIFAPTTHQRNLDMQTISLIRT